MFILTQLNSDLKNKIASTNWTKQYTFTSTTHSGGLYLITLHGGGGPDSVDYVFIASTAGGNIRVKKIAGGDKVTISTSGLSATFTAVEDNFICAVLRLIQ